MPTPSPEETALELKSYGYYAPVAAAYLREAGHSRSEIAHAMESAYKLSRERSEWLSFTDKQRSIAKDRCFTPAGKAKELAKDHLMRPWDIAKMLNSEFGCDLPFPAVVKALRDGCEITPKEIRFPVGTNRPVESLSCT